MELAGTGRKTAEALRTLQENITSGEWPINSRIPKEAELMELLGVGKSTVREAVRSLASVGMLEPIKGVGTFVRSRTPVSSVVSRYVGAYPLEEILDYRRALEIEAVRLAATKRTDSHLRQLRAAHEFDLRSDGRRQAVIELGEVPGTFHHILFEASGNALMAGLYSALMVVIRNAVNTGALAHSPSHELRHQDHAAILQAVEARDPAHAMEAMALHADRDLIPNDDEIAAELQTSLLRDQSRS